MKPCTENPLPGKKIYYFTNSNEGRRKKRGNKISSVVIASLLLGQQQNEYRAGCKLRLALFWANFSFRPKKKNQLLEKEGRKEVLKCTV